MMIGERNIYTVLVDIPVEVVCTWLYYSLHVQFTVVGNILSDSTVVAPPHPTQSAVASYHFIFSTPDWPEQYMYMTQ